MSDNRRVQKRIFRHNVQRSAAFVIVEMHHLQVGGTRMGINLKDLELLDNPVLVSISVSRKRGSVKLPPYGLDWPATSEQRENTEKVN